MRTRRFLVKCLVEPFELRQSASVELPRPADEVWDFMWDPRSSLHWSDSLELAVTLQGTPPRQVGEIQVFVHGAAASGRSGSLLEVVELEVGRRAVTRSLSTWFEDGGALTVEPLDEGTCRLTQEFFSEFPAGTPVTQVEEVRVGQADALQHLVRRLAAVLY